MKPTSRNNGHLRSDDGHVSSPSSPRAKSLPVSAYLRIKREPQEVEDTCISWRFSKGSAEQIIRIDHNIYIKEANDSPKEFGAQRGREVLGEECSLINLERVVKNQS